MIRVLVARRERDILAGENTASDDGGSQVSDRYDAGDLVVLRRRVASREITPKGLSIGPRKGSCYIHKF